MLRLVHRILITTNHIFTGGVYIIAGRIGGPFGSGLPITIRLELSSPGLIIRPPVQYNPMITFHGIFTSESFIVIIILSFLMVFFMDYHNTIKDINAAIIPKG